MGRDGWQVGGKHGVSKSAKSKVDALFRVEEAEQEKGRKNKV